MKIAIVADSHDNISAIEEMCRVCQEKRIQTLVHAGDIIAPFSLRRFTSTFPILYIVFGNNDGEIVELLNVSKGKIKKPPFSFILENKRWFLTHSIEGYELQKDRYDIIVYGHTHEPRIEKTGNTLIINPGELCGYLNNKRTFVIYDSEQHSSELIEL